MRTLLYVFAGAVVGYLIGALAWNFAVMAWSPNTHDRVLEAQMTAAFVGGPLGAVLGAIAGWAVARRR